ncbi:MAG: phenylalanine--tRNA ligase subunit beta [Candidatus Andersenbacteria bacterium CG10_big_fil_rev_8_21_14_0_10_54_11]|uniref:Phenylalanine--tRNA ligase beta subunit n=1 Tax=Candidatus Andersenbacteria bacterium CG10_big_fil_rev_8_21_14_0_10_54_11 TaxID=1974485 RepID=A0A2M6WYZ6_9BACT|nr:MAG: phenylalanine--tRNA ligase subunit beta [Candidatus Andersenbacteria bacterium CG10_big_fil_rev_8_21_14_0_10_54_11]
MQLSYNWLTELLPNLSAAPAEIAEILTMHSFETTVTGTVAIDPHVRTARITRLIPHPNADRLQLAEIDIGQGGRLTVVCGAPNISIGSIVAYAAPGARIVEDSGSRFTLAKATIRGQESAGMLASPRELGLGSHHTGVLLLPVDTPVGTPLSSHIPPDTLLDADVTPNRAHDCMSHLGIARELAALLELTVAEPTARPLPAGPPPDWEVTVENPIDSPRYLGIPVSNVSIDDSPLWLQARLFAVGQRPINNVVDITNYVMFEQGNPLHAFAADRLPAKHIAVRSAHTGEIITTLDGKQLRLQPRQLVIDSGGTAVAVAGIIGGSGTNVAAGTRNLLLEAANFRAYAIQQTSAELRLATESSKRFARGLSPVTAAAAAARAVTLLTDLAGGQPLGLIDRYPHPIRRTRITFRPARVSAVFGSAVSSPVLAGILTRLRCAVEEETHAVWHVTPPPDRLDLTGEHDLIEEAVRVRGFENIPARSPDRQHRRRVPRTVTIREQIRDALASAGSVEVYNRPFEKMQIARKLGISTDAAVAIANPIGPEQAYLRISLLPRLLDNLLANKGEVRLAHSSRSRNVFEIGTVWRTGEGGKIPGVIEEEYAAAVLVDGRDAAALAGSILQLFKTNDTAMQTVSVGRCAPAALTALKLPATIQCLEINISQLLMHLNEEPVYQPPSPVAVKTYQPISKYPPAYRDISLLVAPGTSAEQVQGIIERAGGVLVADTDLFDVYDGDEKTSYAFHIKYQSDSRTLSDDEITAAHQRICAALAAEIGAEIR